MHKGIKMYKTEMIVSILNYKGVFIMINNELNWQKILEIGASSLGSSIGTAIISEMFPSEDSAQEAVKQAVEEICYRVKK